MYSVDYFRFLDIWNAVPEIIPPPDYDYSDLEDAMGSIIDRPKNMYDRLLIIKTNLTKEKFNKMISDLDNAYINDEFINTVSNKSYPFLGDDDRWYDTQFMKTLELPVLNNNESVLEGRDSLASNTREIRENDSLIQDLSNMTINENPYRKCKYYLKILVELGRAYYFYINRGFGNERIRTSMSLYILSNHYFDKIEELFRKYTTSSPEGIIQNNIQFYKSLIAGRNQEIRGGYMHNLITMIFDFEFKFKENGKYDEVTDSIVYKKDLLHKRLEKSKKERTVFLNKKESRKTMANLFQAQSKYTELIQDRQILKNIITEMKEDINAFPEQLAEEIDQVALNMPNDVLFLLVTNNLDDEQIEKYFLESLNQQDSKGLKKIITLFQPNDIKLNSSKNNKVVQLFEIFKQRGIENQTSLSGSLPPESLKEIYEFADIDGGSKKRKYTLKKKKTKVSKSKTKTAK